MQLRGGGPGDAIPRSARVGRQGGSAPLCCQGTGRGGKGGKLRPPTATRIRLWASWPRRGDGRARRLDTPPSNWYGKVKTGKPSGGPPTSTRRSGGRRPPRRPPARPKHGRPASRPPTKQLPRCRATAVVHGLPQPQLVVARPRTQSVEPRTLPPPLSARRSSAPPSLPPLHKTPPLPQSHPPNLPLPIHPASHTPRRPLS